MVDNIETVLEIDKLTVIYNQQGKPFIAVNNVSFTVKKGEIFGLIGESGSGKTTISRSILGLNHHSLGTIKIKNKRLPDKPANIKNTTSEWLSKNVQMIFQDPTTSLNPSKRVEQIILEGFNNYNSYAAAAKLFRLERKIALKWYRKLKNDNPVIIKEYDFLVKKLVRVYQQWQRNQENLIKSMTYEKQDIISNYKYALRGAKTRHWLLIATKNDLLKKESLSHKNNLKNLSGLKKWTKKWDKIFEQELKPLKKEKAAIEKEIAKVETKYKEKLNESLNYLNDIQESLTSDNDVNLLRISKLIRHHQETITSNLEQLTIKSKEINDEYYEKVRQAEKKNDLKAVKKFKNIWKSELKVVKVEIKLQNSQEKRKINCLYREGTRYKYQLLYDTRNDVYVAKQELKQIRKQERFRLIKISQKIEKLTQQLKKQQLADQGFFINNQERENLINNYQLRIATINKSFYDKIKNDKKQINALKLKACELKRQRQAKLKLVKKDFKNLQQQFNNEVTTIVAKIKTLLKNNEKLKFSEKKQQLNREYKNKLMKLTTQYLLQKQSVLHLEMNFKNFIKEATVINNEYVAAFYDFNLYESKKLFLNFKLKYHYNRKAIKAKTRKLVYKTLQSVGLLPEHSNRFPNQFSGGQKQRIGIARTLVMKPSLIIADEPISALDVSIQSQVINILKDLRKKHQISILLVAHDLRMVHYICDRIAVIKNGRILEIGLADEVFYNPIHPYTKSLIAAIPSINRVGEKIKTSNYDATIHEYNEAIVPEWYQVSPTHKILATKKEFSKWNK